MASSSAWSHTFAAAVVGRRGKAVEPAQPWPLLPQPAPLACTASQASPASPGLWAVPRGFDRKRPPRACPPVISATRNASGAISAGRGVGNAAANRWRATWREALKATREGGLAAGRRTACLRSWRPRWTWQGSRELGGGRVRADRTVGAPQVASFRTGRRDFKP